MWGDKMLNSYKEFKDYLDKEIKSLSTKPKLLLHTCCAPCSSYTIKLLKEYFDITIFYSNDNIYPYEEYRHRLDEQIRFATLFDIEVLFDEYSNEDYENAIKGKETLGERSYRCYECYKLRLEKTALKAKELSFDFFTTSLSISPYKVSRWINEIGYNLEEKYHVSFLYSDYKKEEGYKESIRLSAQYNLYRQDFCGCVYSKKERDEKRCQED